MLGVGWMSERNPTYSAINDELGWIYPIGDGLGLARAIDRICLRRESPSNPIDGTVIGMGTAKFEILWLFVTAIFAQAS